MVKSTDNKNRKTRTKVETVNHVQTKNLAINIAKDEALVWDNSSYYEDAEKWLWLFWNEETAFLQLFNQLDKTSMLELACGHGRHSEYLLKNFDAEVKSIVLMDILQSNINYCMERIGVRSEVRYIKNEGTDFQLISDSSLTGIFCYDAMVHFNRKVVKSYLMDTMRVLLPGGKALFHHSNYSFDPDMHFGQNPHARAFMSASLFRKYANEVGLEVIEQKILPWGGEADLDCLSLLARPISE